jgi:hypothetical protein
VNSKTEFTLIFCFGSDDKQTRASWLEIALLQYDRAKITRLPYAAGLPV